MICPHNAFLWKSPNILSIFGYPADGQPSGFISYSRQIFIIIIILKSKWKTCYDVKEENRCWKSTANQLALAVKGQGVGAHVPVKDWEGKAGLRPTETWYGLASSAQIFSLCLLVFVEILIKELSALRRLSTSGSFIADECGHPSMFPSGEHWVMQECIEPTLQQPWTHLWALL